MANQRKEHNVEKYIQLLTTLSMAIRVYLHSFSSCCLPNLRNPAKFSEIQTECKQNEILSEFVTNADTAMTSHPPIPVSEFWNHVDELKSNDGARFSHEYESIEPGQQFTWDASNLDVNKSKNRYANVIAYDHSRVVLQSLDGVVGSDYINANFMDGYRQQNAYIATQVRLSYLNAILLPYGYSYKASCARPG